jgi:hypothetical protein
MGKIIDYKVVTVSFEGSEETTAELGLEKKVKALMKDGWEPLGGVASYGPPIKLSQSMVRRDNSA